MLTFGEIDLAFGAPASDQKQVGFPAVLEYLRRRGIEPDDMDSLGFRIVPAHQLKQMCSRGASVGIHDERLALVIPHFDFQGNMIDWWSARLIETGLKRVTSFSQLVVQGKTLCPPHEPPRAYIPPIGSYTFEEGQRIYIHESAIKAINGAKLGGCHIGLNGVWGWTSRKHNIALVQELRDLPWKRLKLNPVIVFDSNWEDNDQVRLAIARLGAKLQEITGRVAVHLPLPRAEDGSHQGFDDFRMAVGDEAAAAYLAGDGQAIDIGDVEMLKLQLNAEVCVVRSLGRIADQETGTLMTRSTFVDVTFAHYVAQVEDGENVRQVNVPKLWLADSRRSEVERLDYIPGVDERIVERDGVKILNAWTGWGCDPAEGDVSPWLDLLERNVGDEELRRWIIQWFAYPLQHPGEKLNSYLHVWGKPGTGKNALLAPVLAIYGKNGAVCSRDTLASNFNAVMANKQFINFDELYGGSGQDATRITNKIKPIVTGEKLEIEPKGVDKYFIRNCTNIVTTSNYLDALKLDDGDRRAAVIGWHDESRQGDQEYWEGYFAWVKGEGPAALYDYLLGVDLNGFDAKGWAPMTEDKSDMLESTKSVEEAFIARLVDDPQGVLGPIKNYCLVTGRQLAELCYQDTALRTGTINSFTKKLAGARIPKIEMHYDGAKQRFWVVQRLNENWSDPVYARKHLDSVRQKKGK